MAVLTTRRGVVLGGLAVAGAWGYGVARGNRAYDAMVATTRAPLAGDPVPAELVRYATLAANGHNTQPWRFRSEAQAIAILPNFDRRTPVVDPDDHHLYASLGCAAENLRIAARARGMGGAVAFDTAAGSVRVDLTPGAADQSAMFDAIPMRQTTRSVYDGSPVDPEIAGRLLEAARVDGVEPLWVAAPDRKSQIRDLVIEGNTAQMADPAFVAELKSWIRFNRASAVRHGDGLLAAASGNPSLPDWIGPLVFSMAFRAGSENRKYAEQIDSSAGIMVLVAPQDEPAGWVAAGRACQALMLAATVEGLKCAFINQATEVPAIRAELQSLLAIGTRRPSLLLRIGRAEPMPVAPRRVTASVMA